MSDQWSTQPGEFPPSVSSLPPGWANQPSEPPSYGAGPPLPALPPPTAPNQNRALMIGVGALAVLFLIAVGVLIFATRPPDAKVAAGLGTTTTSKGASSSIAPPTTQRGSGQSGTGGSPSTTPAPPLSVAPPPSTAPGPRATQAEVTAALTDVGTWVQQQRGLPYKTPPTVEFLAGDAYTARLGTYLDKDKDEFVRVGQKLAALGLVDPRLDLSSTLKPFREVGLTAFYDDKAHSIVVSDAQVTPWVRQLFANIVTNALDDQYYGIDRPQYETEKDEILFGFDAVRDGDAGRIQEKYNAQMSPADQQLLETESQTFARAAALPAELAVMDSWMSSTGVFGDPFVTAIAAAGGAAGNDAIAQAFAAPPRTSSQVLHPERYAAKDQRVDVRKPQADGKELGDGVFGEVLTQIVLEDGLDPKVADKAAVGWAGDAYVLWDDGNGGVCIRIDYKMTTPAQLKTLTDTYTTWAKSHPGVQVSAAGADLVEVTACSSAGGRSPL